MGDAPRHSVSVTAVVTRDDGRVLIIKRADDGRWVPPSSCAASPGRGGDDGRARALDSSREAISASSRVLCYLRHGVPEIAEDIPFVPGQATAGFRGDSCLLAATLAREWR